MGTECREVCEVKHTCFTHRPPQPHVEIHFSFFGGRGMQIFDSATDVTTGNEWCLWLGTQAWAWARSGQPLQSQPWPDGEPPLEMPFELLGAVLSASFTGSESKPVPVRLVCARWVDGAATDWWPDRKRAVRRWREWLASQGLSLIEVTRADGRQDEEQPGKPHDPRATIWQARQRFSGLLPATAGGRLVASMPAAAVMHVALAQVLRPAWEHHLAQNRRQAELAEQERLDNEADRKMMEELPSRLVELPGRLYRKAKDFFSSSATPPAGSVTRTEKSTTVSPPTVAGRKHGGKC